MVNIKTTGAVSKSFKDPQRYCTACKYPLPPKAMFCPGCGPPCLPDDDQEDDLSVGQTALRITLISLLFAVVVVYKFDVDLSSYLPAFWASAPPPIEKPGEDAKIIYLVAVSQAKVRESDSVDSKQVFSLNRGASVVVLQKKANWWQIQVDDRVGWISSKLLIAKAD